MQLLIHLNKARQWQTESLLNTKRNGAEYHAAQQVIRALALNEITAHSKVYVCLGELYEVLGHFDFSIGQNKSTTPLSRQLLKKGKCID